MEEKLIVALQKAGLSAMYVDIYRGFYRLWKDAAKRDAWAKSTVEALGEASRKMNADDLRSFMTLNALRLAAVLTRDADAHGEIVERYQELFDRMKW